MDIKSFIKEAEQIQDFAAERGYQLLMALGCKYDMRITPRKFRFENEGIEMEFIEAIHEESYAEVETICLKATELEKDEAAWAEYIEKTKKETKAKIQARKDAEEANQRNAKTEMFYKLKKELDL